MAERESNRRKENTARQGVPVEDLEQFARFLLPKIQAFYETEEGQRAFQEWKKETMIKMFSFNLSGLLSAGLSPAPAHSICSQLHLPSSAAASGSAASPITHGGASAELLKESLTRRSMILTAAQ